MPVAIPWSQIDCVLFDMDGTLLDLHFDNYFWLVFLPECYARQQGMGLKEAKGYLQGLFQQHRGTLNWYCTDFWSRTLGLPVIRLKQQVAHRIAPRTGALECIDALRRAGKRLILATNAHPDALALKRQYVALDTCFERMVCSHDYGHPKEQTAFWTRLSEELALEPARCLLIDDSLAVLRCARDFGIGHVLAVQQPDSHAPAQDTQEFAAVADFLSLQGYERGLCTTRPSNSV